MRRHGHYEISVEGNVLVCTVHSAYNVETAVAFGEDAAFFLKRLKRPWSAIFRLNESYPPSFTMDQSRENMRVFSEAGLSAAAFVFENQRAKDFTKELMTELFDGFGIEISFHDHMDSAREWVGTENPN